MKFPDFQAETSLLPLLGQEIQPIWILGWIKNYSSDINMAAVKSKSVRDQNSKLWCRKRG